MSSLKWDENDLEKSKIYLDYLFGIAQTRQKGKIYLIFYFMDEMNSIKRIL